MCGEILTFTPEAKRIGFPVSGFSLSYDGPYQDMFGFRIYSPGGTFFPSGTIKNCEKTPRKTGKQSPLIRHCCCGDSLKMRKRPERIFFPGMILRQTSIRL